MNLDTVRKKFQQCGKVKELFYHHIDLLETKNPIIPRYYRMGTLNDGKDPASLYIGSYVDSRIDLSIVYCSCDGRLLR